MLGRIFAHRRHARTVFSAPLVPIEEDAPAPPVTEPEPEVPEPEPEMPEPEPEVPEPEPEPEAPPVDERVATRYCATCGDRVPLAADGLHCHLGHPLSPAHGRRKRRWWF